MFDKLYEKYKTKRREKNLLKKRDSLKIEISQIQEKVNNKEKDSDLLKRIREIELEIENVHIKLEELKAEDLEKSLKILKS